MAPSAGSTARCVASRPWIWPSISRRARRGRQRRVRPAGAQRAGRRTGRVAARRRRSGAAGGLVAALGSLAPGWHQLSLELVGADGAGLGVRRELSFQVLPRRLDASGTGPPWPERPAPASGPLAIVSGGAGSVTITSRRPAGGVARRGARGRARRHGRPAARRPDRVEPRRPGARPARADGAVGGWAQPAARPRGPDLLLGHGERPAARHGPRAGGRARAGATLAFRIVHVNGLPEYHFGVPEPFPERAPDTVPVALDGVTPPPRRSATSGRARSR